MKATIIGLVAGILFGVGLVVSGMTDPRNVVGFLDFAGHWKPNLAFVMAGAIGVHSALLYVTKRRERAALANAAPLATTAIEPTECGAPATGAPPQGVDRTLIAGAAIFGVGWGLGGYCPGPAIVSVGFGETTPVVFVLSSLAGIVLADWRTNAPLHEHAHLEDALPPVTTAED